MSSVLSVSFEKNLLENIFFTFLYGFEIVMFFKNIVKLTEILNKGNLLKICLK